MRDQRDGGGIGISPDMGSGSHALKPLITKGHVMYALSLGHIISLCTCANIPISLTLASGIENGPINHNAPRLCALLNARLRIG